VAPGNRCHASCLYAPPDDAGTRLAGATW